MVLPDWKDETITVNFRMHVKYNDISASEGHYIVMHNKSVCEFEYPGWKMDQPIANVMVENIIS